MGLQLIALVITKIELSIHKFTCNSPFQLHAFLKTENMKTKERKVLDLLPAIAEKKIKIDSF